MLEKVTSNSYYEISVDAEKNRIFLTIKGFWQTEELVPGFIADIDAAARQVKPGFTALANLTQMKPPPARVGAIHVQAQRLLLGNGLALAAEVIDDAILREVADDYAAETKIERLVFDNLRDAEAWLNGTRK